VDPTEFLNRYGPALATLEEFYSHVRGRGTQVYTNFHGRTAQDFEFAIDGPKHRLVKTLVEYSRDPGLVGKATVRVAHPNLSFQLQRMPSQKDFSIQWAGFVQGDKYEREVSEFRESQQFICAAYSISGIPLGELFKWRDFAIRDVLKTTSDDKNLFQVNFAAKSPGGSTFSGWFTVCPDDAWAVQEYEVRTYKEDPNAVGIGRGVVQYGDRFRGVPLVRSAQLSWLVNGETREHYDCSFSEMMYGPVPEKEFTLAAFGIPQPGPLIGVPPLAYWAILFATLAFVASVMLRLRRGRRRET
jgi:hypothetical protein